MSFALFTADILFYQRFLKANQYYTGKLDGIWGPKTDAADLAFTEESIAIKMTYGRFDNRSEQNILTLAPKAQVLARKCLGIFLEDGNDVRILSGTRTYAEQNALYRKGRYGNTDPIVTKARGGQSNHNFGTAWDIGLFVNGKYSTADKTYIELSTHVMDRLPELEWGGNWPGFPDYPHYQHKTKVTSLVELKGLFEKGEGYV